MSIYLTPVITGYCLTLAALIGLVLGSFLNCAAVRSLGGESFLRGRSHCPRCGHTLGARDLVPLFSWLLLKGRCRYCGAPVSGRYPLTELAFACITVTNLLAFDLTAAFARALVLSACLFVLTLTDLDSYTIPNGCLLAAAAAWLVFAPFLCGSLKDALLNLLAGLVYGGGMLLLSLLMDRLLKKDSLGGGDIKLFGVMGLYLGFLRGLFALLLACLLGLLSMPLTKRLAAGKNPEDARSGQIPFGPAIAAAFWLMLLFGEPLCSWYLGLLGL